MKAEIEYAVSPEEAAAMAELAEKIADLLEESTASPTVAFNALCRVMCSMSKQCDIPAEKVVDLVRELRKTIDEMVDQTEERS